MSDIDAAGLMGTPAAPDGRMPSLAAAFRVWLKIGVLSFGGPAGQIALLHREVVDQRCWIGERRFLNALNFCHLLPGPEAQQLAIYLGWLMHGVKGGLTAGIVFVLPGAAVMLSLSLIYALAGQVPLVDALFLGLKSAVLVLVVEALMRIGRRALKGNTAWSLAGASFVALFFFAVPFPIAVLLTGIIGYAFPGSFSHAAHGKARSDRPALIDALLAAEPDRPARLAASARRAGVFVLVLWLLPVAGLMAFAPGTYADIAWFFSKMAVVTIGGAYAVLAYVAQDAVQSYHWLAPSEMLTGLGLAETTPGPLILVLQFVGFLAGFRAPGAPSGITGGIVASALTLWVTFAPCFAFVFLGAPLIERLQANPKLASALAAITAAVVGVVANLAVWFALHVLFRQTVHVTASGLWFDAPVPSSLDLAAFALAVVAAVALFRLKIGVMPTLAVCAIASIGIYLARTGL